MMTSAKFNAPRLMGNCVNCYYYTQTRPKFEEGVCHRYPKPLDREDMDYCGEFAWEGDAARTDEERAKGADMTETSATEELRRLLDERGVEWYEPPTKPNKTWFPDENGINCSARPWSDTLEIKRHGLTPEQAIAATLGRPKVKKVRGMTYDEHGGEVYFLACSGCGDWIDGDLDCIGEADGPSFCGNCGGEFDGPLLCKRCGELADMEFGDMCAECYCGEGEGNDER